jgi:mono/diheme cytochrome c family protein
MFPAQALLSDQTMTHTLNHHHHGENNMFRSFSPFITYLGAALLICAPCSSVLAGDAAAGKALYDGKGACASCHGPSGAGDGVAAAALNPKPANFAAGAFRLDANGNGTPGEDADLAEVIKKGGGAFGGNAAMPARGDFSDDEIASLVAYIRSLKK